MYTFLAGQIDTAFSFSMVYNSSVSVEVFLIWPLGISRMYSISEVLNLLEQQEEFEDELFENQTLLIIMGNFLSY